MPDKNYLCMTFSIQEGEYVDLYKTFAKNTAPTNSNWEYSVDDGVTWSIVPQASTFSGEKIRISTNGTKMYFRNTNAVPTGTNSGYYKFDYNVMGHPKIELSGSILSMVDPNFDESQTSGSVWNLFDGSNLIVSAKNLTGFQNGGGFGYMFANCTYLKTPPEYLPAKTGISSGTSASKGGTYAYMFYNCRSMEKCPVLETDISYTEVNGYAYMGMFAGCTSITEAPDLPTIQAKYGAYYNMFSECTSLKYPPSSKLPNILQGRSVYNQGPYERMFEGCTSLKYPMPMDHITRIDKSGCVSMYSGCTNIKVSETQSDYYNVPFDLSNAYLDSLATSNMFSNTGGDFQGTPLKKKYYLHISPDKLQNLSLGSGIIGDVNIGSDSVKGIHLGETLVYGE